MADDQKVSFGDGEDLSIEHNSAGNFGRINNKSGHLYIQNAADNRDILFRSDDGVGGLATYFQVDGGETNIKVFKTMRFNNAIKANFGTNDDLQIYHDGTTNNSNIDNATGDLYFTQNTDDGDIIFRNDDGSGGVAEYLKIDGGAVETRFLKSTRHFDNVGAYFGDSADLQIYHDSSNSFISDVGTGNLNIQGSIVAIENTSGANYFVGVDGAQAELYYNGASKLATTNTGISVTGDWNLFTNCSEANSITCIYPSEHYKETQVMGPVIRLVRWWIFLWTNGTTCLIIDNFLMRILGNVEIRR